MSPVLLLTRPAPGAARFLDALAAAGASGFVPVVSPLFSISHRPGLPPVNPEATLVFTSANAVEAYAALGGPRGRVAYAVGPATERAAREAGLRARAGGGDVETLFAHLVAERPRTPLLHLRGAISRGDLVARLLGEGLRAEEAIVYDQPAQPLSDLARTALSGSRPVVAPVFSPRTARQLARNAPFEAPVLVAAMSNAVAEAMMPATPCRTIIAEAPDAPRMVDATTLLLAEAAALEARRGAE